MTGSPSSSNRHTFGIPPTRASARLAGMPPAAAIPVRVAADGRTLVLRLGFRLDDDTGVALLEATRAAAASGAERLDIDLRSVQFFTPAGAAALVECRDIGADLPDGLHYRTGKGPGQDALLSAYADHAAEE
jgi:hypothetical protein